MKNAKSVFFTDGSRRIAFLDKVGISIFDGLEGGTISSLHFPSQYKNAAEDVVQLSLSSDGGYLAALTKQGQVICWSVRYSSFLYAYSSSSGPVLAIQFANDCLYVMGRKIMVAMNEYIGDGRSAFKDITPPITTNSVFICGNVVPFYNYFAAGTDAGQLFFINQSLPKEFQMVYFAPCPIIKILPLVNSKSVIVASSDGKVSNIIPTGNIAKPSEDKPFLPGGASTNYLSNFFVSARRKIFGIYSRENSNIRGFGLDDQSLKFSLDVSKPIDGFGVSSGRLVMIYENGRVCWYDMAKKIMVNDLFLVRVKSLKAIKSGNNEMLVECTRCGHCMWLDSIFSDPNAFAFCSHCKEMADVLDKRSSGDDYD
jgi:WD40 repeat protein